MDGSSPRVVPNKDKWVVLPGDRYRAPIGVKICTMVDMGPGQVHSHFGSGTPGDPQNLKFWPSKNQISSEVVVQLFKSKYLPIMYTMVLKLVLLTNHRRNLFGMS